MKLPSTLILLLFSFFAYAQEICNNGIDDNGNGLIDLNDPQCVCGSTSAIPSIIPNPSFEVNSGCPANPSQLYLATPWIQATEATSDYFNTCGLILPAVVSANLDTFPHGDGIAGALFIGDWLEYLGTELMSPMLAGTNYQLTFFTACTTTQGSGTSDGTPVTNFEPVSITLYGCADGTNLPLAITTCPSDSDPTWVPIGSATYTPASIWSQVTMTFTPSFDVQAIMLGAPPILPPSYPADGYAGVFPYFVFDNLLLNEASAFGVNISQAGTYCTDDLVLSANVTIDESPNAVYQWYRNGVAIVGATAASYSIASFPGNLGQYSVMVTDAGTCYISASLTVNNTIAGPQATVTPATCIVPTGSITVTTPAAQYSFDNGATWQSSPTKSGLEVGSYFIKIQTANGCISAGTGVALLAPQMLSNGAIEVTQPETCDGTGSITINASNAVEYSFDDGLTWTTSNSATGLIPGTYQVIIKDADGCQSGAQNVYISQVYGDEPEFDMVRPTCNSNGSITITSPAVLYSFDNGVNWTTNSTATNLTEGTYMIKTIDSAGCESYTAFVYLYPDYSPQPNYDIVQPTCEALGSITITTVASEYSFDNGATWTTSNVATGLPAGYYQIRVKDAAGCPSSESYVYLYEPYLLSPVYTITHPFCTETTGSITITPQANYTYSFDGGFSYQASNFSGPLAPGSHVIKVQSALGCTSTAIYVYISDPTGIPPAPSGNSNQLFCVFNDPTVSDLVAQGTNIKWYASATDSFPLPADTPLIDGATYYASQTGTNSCESPTRLQVNVAVIVYDLPVTDYATLICDDLNDNNEAVNLTDYNAMIIGTPADYQFSYYTSFAGADGPIAADYISNAANFPLQMGSNAIYVRVLASNGCWKVATLTLTMIPAPFNMMPTTYFVCEDFSVTMSAPHNFDGYLWSTGQTSRSIFVYEPGSYWVTISKNHNGVVCSTTTTVEVILSNPPVIQEIETSDWTESSNTIVVHLSPAGLGNYEYSIDGINYQPSNVFEGLASGVYQVYVRDINGCGDDDEEAFLLTYPKYFTPNGDGHNDRWHVKFARYEADLEVSIFDRHGKFIRQLFGKGDGWDGTLNGRDLPSSDYWFVVTRADGKVYKGHFSMVR